MKDDILSFTLIIPHTQPETPVIRHLYHATHLMRDGGEIPEEYDRILLLTNAIFLKSEFAKKSYRIIEDCYSRYGLLWITICIE